MKLLVTGASGFLGSRSVKLLRERGHEVVALVRPDGRPRAGVPDDAIEIDAGDVAARELVSGCDAVLHFAGVPDPASAARDPARAIRENAGTTLNLLDGCAEHGAGLVYPSTLRAALAPPPDDYAMSKRLGELVCKLHRARATALRLPSVFGPGQVAWEGATGAIASFAARALDGEPLTIPGDPERTRDFVYVDDVVAAFETVAAGGPCNTFVTVASGPATPLLRASELVVAAAGSSSPIETPGGMLPPGENESYRADGAPSLPFSARPLEEAITAYVDWLRRHPAAQSRTRA
ncbi:MAG: NAD-dependent epimerase/dehydratase family protein [Gaiellaceae bacterium]